MKSFSSSNYFPAQPEYRCSTNNYIEKKPANRLLGQTIVLYYQFQTNEGTNNSISIIPDGAFDILFCCDPHHPHAVLWTNPLFRRPDHNFKSNREYFGIRFVPEQSVFKLKDDMKNLLNQQIILTDVLDVDSYLLEQICGADTFDERIKKFEEWISIVPREITNNQKAVNYCIQKIYSSNGLVKIEELSADTGYSTRYLRRIFEQYIGFSPKQFSQIIRFQNSLHMVLHHNSAELLDIAIENGYFDQAHFNRMFKKFVRLSPMEFKEHYYNSLNASKRFKDG